ncbi:MAG: DUF2332 domain-containing protein [Hyphomonadaceae bacterium]|nr:DUF2332 domain-containing protein [Hyphomonadaceae bacterium]
MSAERLIAHFREQAGYCAAFGSPFTAALNVRFAEDVEAGGPVAALTSPWPSNPSADVVGLRLAGALHAAVLSGRDEALAAAYPGRAAQWRVEEVWPIARAFLEREREWVRSFLRYAPQTNETRRSIALLGAFLAFAETWRGPIDLLEIGASAGLNLNWDRFRYQTSTWAWGDPASPVLIDTDWQASAPPLGPINVRHRAACDINPLDLHRGEDLLRLKSYIWPDQPDRLARFEGAVALARQCDARVDRADAGAWLEQKLAERAQDTATLVYHSVFLQYPPRETRETIIAAIQAAGSRASASAPLAWARLEPEAVTDGVMNGLRFVIDLTTWPGGERRIVGYTDGHVRAVYAP